MVTVFIIIGIHSFYQGTPFLYTEEPRLSLPNDRKSLNCRTEAEYVAITHATKVTVALWICSLTHQFFETKIVFRLQPYCHLHTGLGPSCYRPIN